MLLGRGPCERDILLYEVEEGMSDLGIDVDEATVEVTKTKEGLYFFDFGGTRPFSNSLDFSRVHSYVAIANDNSKVFNGRLVKGAFFRLEVKVVLG